jgi:hypothetical protein
MPSDSRFDNQDFLSDRLLELEYKDLAKARYKKTFAVQLGVVMIGTVKEPGERAFVGALEFSEVG